MIQLRLAPNELYTISEMGQMAVEGGCGWLVISMPGAEPGAWRDVAEELVPLCRDAGVMLSVENDIDAVRELGAHGVYLTPGANPAKVREDLGAEAIIGAGIASVDSAVALAKADIDYLTLAPGVDCSIIGDARKGGAEVPFVAVVTAGALLADYSGYIEKGFDGFYVTDGVFDTDDPVSAVRNLISLTK